MTSRSAGCTIGVVLVALASGCGASDEEKAKTTVSTYLEAVAKGDGKAACDQLTGEARREILQLAYDQVPEFQAPGCSDAVNKLADSLGADEKSVL